MKLYFNGCSFTYGDELNNPSKDSWPSLVANFLNADFLNDAVCGGTNERTLYKTIENINNFDYFFIAWTLYNRFTEYNPVDNYEINFTPLLNMNPELHSSDDLRKNYWKYENYGKLYYSCWFNELYELKKWLQQIVLLQSLFKTRNKKYLMVNTFNNHLDLWLKPEHNFNASIKNLLEFFDSMNDDQLLQEFKNIQNLNNMIDKSHFVEWNQFCMFNLPTTFKRGPRGHILEEGHATIAKKILDYYHS